MAEGFELAAEMMRPDAGLHSDQARRHIGKAGFYLGTRPLLTQHDHPAVVETDDMKRVLPNIDANYADRLCCCGGHGVLLVWVPPASILLAG
jgi:hypothetical protein